MSTNVSGPHRPGGVDHSPPPPSPAKAPNQMPSVEETARFKAIIDDPEEDASSGGGQIEDGDSSETGAGSAGQPVAPDFSARAQVPVVQPENQVVANYLQGNSGLQDDRESSDSLDNERQNSDIGPDGSQSSSVQCHNEDTSQRVQAQSGQQNNQGDSSGGGHSHEEKSTVSSEKYAAEMGLSILSSLGAIEETPPTPEADSTGSRQAIVNLGQELLDKFYSSTSGDKSVYLELKVLDGAKVLLTKAEGVLSIQFDATTAGSADLLENMKSGLADYMEKRLGQTVEVKVKNLASGDQAGGDGRSKQQRNVLEEYQPGASP